MKLQTLLFLLVQYYVLVAAVMLIWNLLLMSVFDVCIKSYGRYKLFLHNIIIFY